MTNLINETASRQMKKNIEKLMHFLNTGILIVSFRDFFPVYCFSVFIYDVELNATS